MALSPWPTSPAALAAAVTQLKAAVQGAALDSDERAAQLGAVASAMVEQYALGAPGALKDEAVIRFAGYPGAVRLRHNRKGRNRAARC